MEVRIFSITFFAEEYCRSHVENLQAKVNAFLKERPKAKAEWLQSSTRNYVTLTAIVSYENSATPTTNPS